MACYSPLEAWRVPGEAKLVFSPSVKQRQAGDKLHLPCGQCFGCRVDHAASNSLRMQHERRYHDEAAFVTLTYNDESLPALGDLVYDDVKLAYKRVRKSLGPFRHFTCGEYGDRTGRAHWHAIIFGHAFERGQPRGKSEAGTVCYDSPQLEKLWGKGRVTVGDATPESMSYVARYVQKKLNGQPAEDAYTVIDEDGVILGQRRAPFARCSNRPGIGAQFVHDYAADLLVNGCVVMHGGVQAPMPGYYERLLLRDPRHGERMQDYKDARGAFDAKRAADNTPERLAVREEVARAKRRQLKRGM